MKSKDDLKKWTFYLAGLVWLIAAAALVGWWLNIDFLKRPIPNLASMNPTTALGFSLSSIAFFLIFSTRFSTNPKRIGMVLSLFVFFLGFAKAVATIFDLPFHIDQVLFRERLADENSSIAMSSMSPNGALNLMLVGIILALGRIRPVVSQSISVFVFLLAWFPILGYIYQVPEFYGLLPFFPMAIHTAFCFILLSLAFFFSQPGIGWPSEFMSDFEGGRLVRVLIPLAIIVPTGMGYIRLWGHWTNLFSTEFGIALMVSGIILVFVWGVAYNAKRLNKRDYERTKISEELAKSGQSIKEAHEEIATINEELQATNEKMIAANEELLANNEELNIVNEQLLAASEKIQVQSETIHRQKEERLNRVLESSNHIAWSFDLTGTGEDYISRSAEKIWGISSELFLRNKEISTEMVYPSDRELWGVARQRLNQFGQTQEICRFLDHQGQVRWMRIQVWITKDEHGALIRQEGVASDVSELEKSERALQNERKLLRSLIDNIPDYIFVKDKQSKHVINNRANVNLLGARNEVETLGKSLADFFGDSASTYLEDDRYVIASGLPLINKEEIIVTDSGARVLLTTKVPLRDEDGNITGLTGISRDITELRIQEQLLNQFRENMDIIFSNTVEEIVLMDREGKVILFNKALERFIEFAVGKKPEVGMYVWDMTVKERREIAKGLFSKALQGENIVVDAPIETSAGLVIHELNYEPVFVDGKVKYLTLISVDVTEKRARENLLRESEANLRSILNATQEAVILLNTDHEVITLNESY